MTDNRTGYSLRIEGQRITGRIELTAHTLNAVKGAAQQWFLSTARGVRVSVVDSDGFVVWTLEDSSGGKTK